MPTSTQHWGSTPPQRNTPEWKLLRDRLLASWQQQKDVLDKVKADELTLRTQLVSFLGNPSYIGTETVEIGNGWKLKIERSLNYNFTSEEALTEALLTLASDGAYGVFIVDRLITHDPRLIVSEYKRLSPQHKAIIDSVLLISKATPTVELVPPKGTIQPAI